MKITYTLSTFLLLAALFFVSCNNFEEELAQQTSMYDSLLAQTQSKDSAMLSLVTAFNEIDENLQMIKEKENIINTSMGGEGVPKDYRQRVMDDIQSIYSLMETNKAKIEDLNEKLASVRHQLSKSNKKLSAANMQLLEYEKLITSLTNQVETKDHQIAQLTEDLVRLNFELDSMGAEYRAKSQLADEQMRELNTAYYVFDSKKALRDNNIIETKGGVIGIGKTKMLKKDFSSNYFTKINIQETKSIGIYSKKATIITNHPSDSYAFAEKDGQVEKLIIKDPVSFWSSSKHLVIIVE